MTFSEKSKDELERIYLERALTAGVGAPGSSNVTVTNAPTSPVPVALSASDLAALEQTTVTVTNPTANPETGLAKEVTLAAVRDRATFPIPATQITDLKTVTVSNPTANPETGLAKEITLAAINANTDAVESLLTTLRDTVYRRTDPLPSGNNLIGRVVDTLEVVTLLNLASAARTVSTTEGPYAANNLSRVAFDVNVSAVAGVGPSMTLFIERQGADSVWYPIYTSPAVTAARTVSTSVGQGMTVAQSLASNIRVRYDITGTNASFTFSASLVGK